MKQMFNLVLNKLDKIDTRLDQIEQRLDKVEQRLDKVEQRLDKVEQRLDSLEHRMEKLEDRVDLIETTQKEMFGVVKAIEHSNYVRKAEIDSMNYKIANVEGTFNEISDIIENRKAI
ncbi:hypothetical protein EDC18_102281 [Natranaerovirga pectinivora]|uniref:t-SNARE coiled-coil homology domain-containing protein n=2 Tax=Natranaerovirga pectinivora TaxID=682400 RepID=A0A4R3MT85_9FIRM|nr:hypothetical protein EDC18_102281 [Natranaerovirga pectinivora]